MADDINTCTGFGSNDADKRITGPIKNGTPVVQAPRKSFNTNNFVDEDILKNFKGKIISVSRANVIDNTALYNNLDNISHAYIDTLDSKYREELLESGKVTYTKHTAWSHNFSYENNQEYYSKLQIRILNPEAYKPVLPRTERVTF